MIIVFPFIVLKYFSFCCHSSHSVFCCNRLVYSCFILIVKSDSNLKQNYFCQFSLFFQFYLSSFFSKPVFSLSSSPDFYIILFFFFFMSSFLAILSLCHSVFCFSFFFLSFCLFSSFCRTSSILFFSHF